MLPQRSEYHRGKRDCAIAHLALRLALRELSLDSLQRASDIQPASVEIDIRPFQPEDFTLARSEARRDREKRFESMAADQFKELPRLGDVEHV